MEFVRVVSLAVRRVFIMDDAEHLLPAYQRILRAAGQEVPKFPPILEINPEHPMVERLTREDKRFKEWSELLFDQALLAEGGTLEDPAGFVKRMNELMLELAGGGSRIWTPG
jgi:molecular chaperone HtpG